MLQRLPAQQDQCGRPLPSASSDIRTIEPYIIEVDYVFIHAVRARIGIHATYGYVVVTCAGQKEVVIHYPIRRLTGDVIRSTIAIARNVRVSFGICCARDRESCIGGRPMVNAVG